MFDLSRDKHVQVTVDTVQFLRHFKTTPDNLPITVINSHQLFSFLNMRTSQSRRCFNGEEEAFIERISSYSVAFMI